MLADGYAAVTYRRVAAKAGVTAGLVQYYFPTLDDLFIALLDRRAERNLEKFSELLEAHPEGPLRAIWEYSRDETTAALMMEFMALGNHRKAIRARISTVSRRAKRSQLDALTAAAGRYRFDKAVVPPAAILFLLAGIPKIMLMEGDLGVFTGHAETLALVEHYLGQIESVGTSTKIGTAKVSRSHPRARRTSTA
jgi:AcrR family transcriptional regulator